jgi:hypothetical protein
MGKRYWQARAAATLIGSMPHRDRQGTIDLILRDISEVPVWPQLAAFKPEQMMVQYLEGLPGLRTQDGHTYLQTDGPEFEQELLSFYEEYLEVDAGAPELDSSRFRMGAETGRTFFQFLETLTRTTLSCRAIKGQIVGPFTLLSGLTDHNRRVLLYDERLTDVVVKHLAMKARWQIARLQALGVPVIIFLDEPALAGYGSSTYISISAGFVRRLLDEVVAAIQQAGGLAGIHICANTDWQLVLNSSIDIINFDAYNYFDRFALYGNDFSRHLASGRIIAWGMVPTDSADLIYRETAESLAKRWFEQIRMLATAELPVQSILSKSLFTPSCGCGSLTEEAAERVVRLTRRLSELMQDYLRNAGKD